MPRILAGVPLTKASAGSPSLETHCQVQAWLSGRGPGEARAAHHPAHSYQRPSPPAPVRHWGPEASKVRRMRSLLVRFQLGQLRLRDKESGQVPPSQRPSQAGAWDPRPPALGHLSCSAFEKAAHDDQEDALPACPQTLPARAPAGPLNSLNPWPHLPHPLQARLRLRQTVGHCLDGKAKQTKPPGDFCLDPGRSGRVSPGPGSEAGTEHGVGRPPEAQRS